MIQLNVKSNVIEVLNFIKSIPSLIHTQQQKNLTKDGIIAQREARKNAPYEEGDLERSINYEVGNGFVKIFVAKNSRAGAYAARMEYDKYNEGKGTKMKSSRAGRLYIQRAINDNMSKFKKIMGNIIK